MNIYGKMCVVLSNLIKKKKKKKWLTRKTFAKKVKKMVKVQVSAISLNQKRSNIYNWSIENEMKCWK